MSNKFSEFKANPQKKIEEIKNENPEQVEELEELMEKYKNLSQQELMQEFLQESKRQKNSGELNENSVSKIRETLQPFLNNEQQKNLDNLLRTIDDK